MLGAEWGTGQVLWSILWLVVFFLWLWLAVGVFADIFRSHDLSGVAKFFWVLFVIVLPYIGVFAYLVVRGGKMAQHEAAASRELDAEMRAYIHAAAGNLASVADELERLKRLHTDGVIDDSEFRRLKDRLIGSDQRDGALVGDKR